MAERPVFVPTKNGNSLVHSLPIEFKWHAGLSVSQKQKSIRSLHEAALSIINEGEILEISSKSEIELGRKLSAFALELLLSSGEPCTVECAFQGSKVFTNGGPYTDLFGQDSRSAKKDERIKNSGNLIAFEFEGESWPLDPITCFYDWIYINAVHQIPKLRSSLMNYSGFSDIEFNPKKSLNCQAQSAARYVALHKRGLLQQALSDKEFFKRTYESDSYVQIQGTLF
jgi:hypothetical protein